LLAKEPDVTVGKRKIVIRPAQAVNRYGPTLISPRSEIFNGLHRKLPRKAENLRKRTTNQRWKCKRN